MEKVLDKISEYGIINNIFPGAVFVYALDLLFKIKIQTDDVLIMIFVYYFVGVILSRVGSIVVEPVLKKFKLLNRADYKEFVAAEKKDEKIQILLGVGNMYRTLIAVIIMLAVTKGVNELVSICPGLKVVAIVCGVICLLILLIISYRKQTDYIRKRVECLKEED